MDNLKINICGISSPNPFWLASSPVSNSGTQIMRAFDAGWGGAIWKTITTEKIENVSPRLSSSLHNKKILGINNIEVLSDRSLDANFKEIYAVKKAYAKNPIIASIAAKTQKDYQHLIKRCEDSGVDGIEINLSCPHGMPERNMGAACCDSSDIIKDIVYLVKETTKLPVFTKLTPMHKNISIIAKAAKAGGTDGISLINTISSITGVDLDNFVGKPKVANKFAHGGYCGPSVKPIALYLVAKLAKDESINLPIFGIGGISNWQDAAEFLALGATSVQVCTAVMLHGYAIIEDMLTGLSQYLKAKKMPSIKNLIGSALLNFVAWKDLDLNHKVVANIDPTTCIACQKCYTSCLDGGHQSIHSTKDDCHAYHGTANRTTTAVSAKEAPKKHQAHPHQINGNDSPLAVPYVDEKHCAGCGLCTLVCPTSSISMRRVEKKGEA